MSLSMLSPSKSHRGLAVGDEPQPGYRLTRMLGSARQSRVWEAEVEGRGSVALKFLPCPSGPAAAKAIRALQTFRQLTHPNLMSIDHLWHYRDYLVIEMKLAMGSLEDFNALHCSEYGTPLPPDEICRYLLSAAKTLDFLNARTHRIDNTSVGFQHCNVKPSNLMLVGDDIQLSDFEQITILTPWKREQCTSERSTYAAPEVCGGQPSQQADQYALALCYYVLRGGTPPPALDLTILYEVERWIVERALTPNPHCRWGSCTEFMEQLSNCFVGVCCDTTEC